MTIEIKDMAKCVRGIKMSTDSDLSMFQDNYTVCIIKKV